MNPFLGPQELARQFNEDEAVCRCYEQKRRRRRLPGSRVSIPEAVLDALDWLEAEGECREKRYIGKPM
jgi:hypothetical protein